MIAHHEQGGNFVSHSSPRDVFVAGSTGYMGSSLIPALLTRGHKVRALARAGSQGRLPDGCEGVSGDPLDRRTFEAQIAPADTFVHLVGTPEGVRIVAVPERRRTAESI